MKLGELFIKLGFDVDNAKLENFEKGVKSTAKKVLALKVAFAGAVYGLDKFVGGTVQGVAALKNINEQTGLSIELLQKWQKAGQLSNLALSAEQISGSIQNLQKSISDIKLGKGNIGAFQMLGIDANNKDAFQVLDKLRDRIGNLSPDVASNLISGLGLDPAMVSVLKLSREEFDRLGRNDFLTEKGRNSILATGKAIKDLKLRFSALKDQIALQLSPILLKLLNGFFKWIIKNKNNIIGAIKFITKWLGNFFDALKNAASLVGGFVSDLLNLEGVAKGLGIAFGLLIAVLKPVWFRIGLIIGLLDDIKVWKSGGDSMFGSFYEWVSKVYDKLKPVFDMLTKVKDMLNDGAVVGGVAGATVGGPAGAAVGFAGGGILDFFLDLSKNAKQHFINTGEIDERGRRITNNANSTNNKIEINIIGGDSPRETAKSVERELNNALTATGNSFSR